ncbi:MAG: hypothetical protein AAFO82_19290, partial [Bacteroidota bacterium]
MEQPNFIHSAIINGRQIAFLGEKPFTQEDLHNKFIRTNKMVIPAGAQMVNPDSLRKKIKSSQSTVALDMNTEEEKLFWGEPLKDTILLDVCGKLSETAYKNIHFHHCENHIPSFPWIDENTSLKSTQGGTCQIGIFTSYMMDEVLKHDLAIFYISSSKIEESDRKIA